jgi:small subunit ribosomal protein S21
MGKIRAKILFSYPLEENFRGSKACVRATGPGFQYDETSPFGRFGGVTLLAEVRLQEGEPLENALRRFKRKVQQEDIIKEVKRHSYYLKPGEKKRVKAALARKRNRKKARKEQD